MKVRAVGITCLLAIVLSSCAPWIQRVQYKNCTVFARDSNISDYILQCRYHVR